MITATPALPEVLVRISNEEVAYQVVEIDSQVWVALKSGAYYVDGNSLISVWKGTEVRAVKNVRGEIWFGTDRGLYRRVGEQFFPHLQDEIGTPRIMAIQASADGLIWLGTDQGIYRIKGNTALQTSVRESVYAVEIIDGETWAGTIKNGYCFSEVDFPELFFDEENPKAVSDITNTTNGVWLITNAGDYQYGAPFRVDSCQQPIPVLGLDKSGVTSVAEIDGDIWFGTTRGVFQLPGETRTLVNIQEIDEPINTIKEVKGQVWIGTTERAYVRIPDGSFRAVPGRAKKLGIKGIVEGRGKIWLWGETGAYRIDREVQLVVEPTTHSVIGLPIHLGHLVGVAKARYDRAGKDPYNGEIEETFGVILESDLDIFHDLDQKGEFAPISGFQRWFRFGFQGLYYVGCDAFGNTTDPVHSRMLVLPRLGHWLFWLLSTLLFVGLAIVAVHVWTRSASLRSL